MIKQYFLQMPERYRLILNGRSCHYPICLTVSFIAIFILLLYPPPAFSNWLSSAYNDLKVRYPEIVNQIKSGNPSLTDSQIQAFVEQVGSELQLLEPLSEENIEDNFYKAVFKVLTLAEHTEVFKGIVYGYNLTFQDILDKKIPPELMPLKTVFKDALLGQVIGHFSGTTRLDGPGPDYQVNNGIRIIFSNSAGNMLFERATGENGAFGGDYLVHGQYSIEFFKPGYLKKTARVTYDPISSNIFNNGSEVILSAGDINSDGSVDIRDLAKLGLAWKKTRPGSGYLEEADFNKDGTVNILDLAKLAANWKKKASSL